MTILGFAFAVFILAILGFAVAVFILAISVTVFVRLNGVCIDVFVVWLCVSIAGSIFFEYITISFRVASFDRGLS